MHLLLNFTRQLTGPTIIGCDNQAVIRGLNNQQSHSGHHLLDHIHKLEEQLHAKQDIHWVPGHKDFEPNERADREAKDAAQKLTSPAKDLPVCLRKKVLPASVAALRQEYAAKLKRKWTKCWRKSPRRTRTAQAAPTPDQMCGLTHTSQLRDGARNDRALTGHAPLKQHLHRIKCADSPICPSCEMEPETTAHFLIWPPGRCCVPCNHQAPSARKEAPILG
ncbi:hypothetical protein FIBSPDRAFT_763388 [Athelia psychrophila]|uniref:RNase H type-1 domain-containing protein n=1 Tax=Athelia psychrophila TaxID=1759441 RepID=A0A167XD72_9AGAM|nr:hypothetical protein FIBSPDRAFT_763388 [Fibularhizoctonia sp. CBS 109695]